MQNTYHKQTAHFISLVCRNMPALTSAEMQKWIEHPERMKAVLANFSFVEKEKCPTEFLATIHSYNEHKNVGELLDFVESSSVRVAGGALFLLKHKKEDLVTSFAAKKEPILYTTTGKDLGFSRYFSYDQLRSAASAQEFRLCSHDVPFLFMHECVQSGEYVPPEDIKDLIFVCKPLFGSNGQPMTFEISFRGEKPLLSVREIVHDLKALGHTETFVFMS